MRNSLQSNDYFGSKMPLLRMAFIIPFPSIPEEALTKGTKWHAIGKARKSIYFILNKFHVDAGSSKYAFEKSHTLGRILLL